MDTDGNDDDIDKEEEEADEDKQSHKRRAKQGEWCGAHPDAANSWQLPAWTCSRHVSMPKRSKRSLVSSSSNESLSSVMVLPYVGLNGRWLVPAACTLRRTQNVA